MKKIILVAAMAVLVLQPMVLFAATAKCRVVKSNGSQLVLECPQIVGRVNKGDIVKLKTEPSASGVKAKP